METQSVLSRREMWLVNNGTHLVWRGPRWNTLPDADRQWAHSLLISHGTPGNMLYLLLKGGLLPDKDDHGARVALEPAPIRMIF